MRFLGDPNRAPPTRQFAAEGGISIVESLVSLFMMTVIALSVAQLIAVGAVVNRASSDVTTTTALAEQKMEQLRGSDYTSIAVGGSLESDLMGFFEVLDADANGDLDFRTRWQVTDAGVSKTIQVYVTSELKAIGEPKETTLAYLVAAQ